MNAVIVAEFSPKAGPDLFNDYIYSENLMNEFNVNVKATRISTLKFEKYVTNKSGWFISVAA